MKLGMNLEKNLQKNNDIFWNIKEYNLEKFEIILNAIPKKFIKN